jgi:hypothetical protein
MKPTFNHIFPNLSKSDCVIFTVCSEVHTKNQSLVKLLSKKKEYFTKYQANKGTTHLRVAFGGGKKPHLHIDCVQGKYLSKKAPKANTNIAVVKSLMERFFDSPVEFGIRGVFVIPNKKMPKRGLISSITSEEKIGEISFKLAGGHLEVKGSPITDIIWSFTSKENVVVEIRGERKDLTINKGFLKEQFQWLNDQLNLFVLMGT